jgi:hypothetical protein
LRIPRQPIFIMTKAWTDKTEYKIFSGQLASSSRYDFERAVLPFIRIIWADTFAPKTLGSYDRIGIDLLVWADREPFALVVQLAKNKLTNA